MSYLNVSIVRDIEFAMDCSKEFIFPSDVKVRKAKDGFYYLHANGKKLSWKYGANGVVEVKEQIKNTFGECKK